MKRDYQYVIGVPNRESQAVIGPFASREAANDYVVKAKSDYPCPVLVILDPVDDPEDDADLHP